MPTTSPSGTVGVIVNPVAGKDIRRLSSSAGHTADTTKMGIIARVVAAAAESGARQIFLADDPHRLARRATDGLHVDAASIELLSDHVSGSRLDTIGVATELWKRGADVVVVLGGDGTCRDAACGWPEMPLIAISTGTNNVYPSALDGTSAGVAAGLIAAGVISLDRVAHPTKRIVVQLHHDDGRPPARADDIALVDLALVSASFVGARAVRDPTSVRAVLAAIGHPASTGLSSIAGRLHPIDRWTKGGLHVRLRHPGEPPARRRLRVPLSPGSFDTMEVAEVCPVSDGEPVEWRGPGVLAFDGERDLPISSDTTVTAWVERSGPRLVDVHQTITLAAHTRSFDLTDPEGFDAD